MPELPEVETVRRGLNQLTLAQTIRGGEVLLNRSLAYPESVQTFLTAIEGKQITVWERRGKYLLAKLADAHFQDFGWLGVHLRMTGQLLWLDNSAPLQKHTRIRLFLGEQQELRFVDTRTFGKMWWVPPEQKKEAVITGLQKIGPEPFDSKFSPSYLQDKLRKTKRPIKTVLLDQRIVAGIGNIYADETLFKSGIAPDTIAQDLNLEQIKTLHRAIIEVLNTAIDKGGTTFSDFLNLLGVNGNYGGVAWVYGRGGEPCRVCGTVIEKMKLGGRSTHFCPQCQPR